MSDYEQVKKALAQGVEPAAICSTCPWDRYCVEAPTMTSGEVKGHLDEAAAKDEQESRLAKTLGNVSYPMNLIMTTLAIKGEDTKGQMCPVFTVRLRASSGRSIAESIKQNMQAQNDNEVSEQ